MKSLYVLISVLVVVGLSACGQKDSAVPAKVKTSFSQKFPAAVNVKWQKENEAEWEAEFKLNNKEYSANFDNEGSWMETEYEMKLSDIPALVKATIDETFAAYKIEESEVSETRDGILYEFELEKGKNEFEVTIDSNGVLIKKDTAQDEE